MQMKLLFLKPWKAGGNCNDLNALRDKDLFQGSFFHPRCIVSYRRLVQQKGEHYEFWFGSRYFPCLCGRAFSHLFAGKAIDRSAEMGGEAGIKQHHRRSRSHGGKPHWRILGHFYSAEPAYSGDYRAFRTARSSLPAAVL